MWFPDDYCTCDAIGGPVIRRCPAHSLLTLTPEGQARLDEIVRRLAPSHVDHDWMLSSQSSFSTWRECKRCGVNRRSVWAPGWPATVEYYTEDGVTDIEPSCCERLE